jgi:hypothetical protein
MPSEEEGRECSDASICQGKKIPVNYEKPRELSGADSSFLP